MSATSNRCNHTNDDATLTGADSYQELHSALVESITKEFIFYVVIPMLIFNSLSFIALTKSCE